MHGILVVDKPAGATSAAVVAQVKRRLGVRKIGHTGTLDPMATGVLPLCIGDATKIAGYLLADDKAYQGELELGIETDTLDIEGRVTGGDSQRASAVETGELEGEIAKLTGRLQQVPPMFSALKKDGVRLHELARRGETVEREPRSITVHAFELLEHHAAVRRARFRVECSKGTYVRSLVRDLGRALGCGATLTALRRTRSGRFGLEGAVALDDLDPDPPLICAAEALAHLPAASVAAQDVARVVQGQRLPVRDLEPPPSSDLELLRLLTPRGDLLALAEVRNQRISYVRVFPGAAESRVD